MEIPGFSMIEKVGEGAMAFVWKAHQESLDRVVAVKMLRPQFAQDPEEIKGFIREAQAAAALKHPNVIQVYDIAQTEDSYYLVMEYINGPTVGHLLSTRGALPPKKALTITRYVAEALEYAWEKARLVHRDVKPHNILIDADGTVKLSDLGLAKIVDAGNLSAQIEDGVLAGTPNYISPEQARCEADIDCRCDVYGLGASLYHMVTGVVPFGDYEPMQALEQHLKGELANPRDVNPGLHLGIAQLISRMMMRDRADRFADWQETVAAIKRAEAGRIMLDNTAAPGKSTVAAAKDAGDIAGKVKEVRRAGAKRIYSSIPPVVRRTAWACIVAAWALLGWHRLRLPALELLPEKRQPAPAAVEPPAPQPVTPPVVTPEPRPRPDPVTPVQPAPEPPSVVTPEPGGPTPEPEPPAIATPETPTPVTPPPPAVEDSLRRPGGGLIPPMNRVISALKEEDFRRAESIVKQELDQPHSDAVSEQLESIRDIVIELPTVQQAIEKEFVRHLGTEVTIEANGKPVKMVLRSVVRGKIMAEVKTGYNKKQTIAFMIDQLSPAERARWVPGKSQADNAMRCILHMRAGQRDEARETAPGCGALSDIFDAALGGQG